jgi:hypothetical protein
MQVVRSFEEDAWWPNKVGQQFFFSVTILDFKIA